MPERALVSLWQGEGHHTGRQDTGQSHHPASCGEAPCSHILNFIFCKSFFLFFHFLKKKSKVDGNKSRALDSVYMWVSARGDLQSQHSWGRPVSRNVTGAKASLRLLRSVPQTPGWVVHPAVHPCVVTLNVNRENKLSWPIFEECISTQPCNPRSPPRSLYHRLL